MRRYLLCAAILVCLLAGSCLGAQTSTSGKPEVKARRVGVLLLAHGGRLLSWNEEVHHVADQVDLKIPTEIALGMATRSSIQGGIDRLTARGVTEIVAVPLFVSSHSSVIDSTAYLLGLRPTAPEELEMFASMDHGGGMTMDHGTTTHDGTSTGEASKPIRSSVPIRMTPALDHHALVASILKERAATISQDAKREVVILVAHGPVPDDENVLWLQDMKILADKIQGETQYAGIEFLTLRDDADDKVRDLATKDLRHRVEQVNLSQKTALVVPLLLSYGGIEDGLRERLHGLEYRIPSQGLLPDGRIVEWVIASAK